MSSRRLQHFLGDAVDAVVGAGGTTDAFGSSRTFGESDSGLRRSRDTVPDDADRNAAGGAAAGAAVASFTALAAVASIVYGDRGATSACVSTVASGLPGAAVASFTSVLRDEVDVGERHVRSEHGESDARSGSFATCTTFAAATASTA